MAEQLKEYTVQINGLDHTMRLSEKDAKDRGAVEVKRDRPQNKARTAENK